jgi:hypothetical protein
MRAVPARPAPVCEDAKEDVPSDDNDKDTVFVAIPSQCKGRINEVLVKNAHSDNPIVYVRCAVAETPLGSVGPSDGGVD